MKTIKRPTTCSRCGDPIMRTNERVFDPVKRLLGHTWAEAISPKIDLTRGSPVEGRARHKACK